MTGPQEESASRQAGAPEPEPRYPLENEEPTDSTPYPNSGQREAAQNGESQRDTGTPGSPTAPPQPSAPPASGVEGNESGTISPPAEGGRHAWPGEPVPGGSGTPVPGGQPPPMPPPPEQAPLPPMSPQQAQQPPAPPPAPPAPATPQNHQYRQPALGANDLTSAQLIKQQKPRPQSGWRKALYVASGHLINLGESPADQHRRELIGRVNQPLRGCYKIAMLSLKGGVGKTTATTTLGSTFASLRGDRVIAVDANPDRGTLSQKIPLETTATVRHLLRDANRITRYSDVRSYTSQGPSRLEILASDQDPAVSEAYSETDYRRTIDLLEHFYNIVLTDCGTGLMHSAMRGVLGLADSLVLVSSCSVDGARSALATLDWLDAHGHGDLVARSVTVINSVRSRGGSVDLDKLVEHFSNRCRAVCRIPFDPHLEEGAEIELDRLAPATRTALLELAATVADDFPNDTRGVR
ncbi:MAG: AAA family ATPase [Pseudonocardiaceae bacterium]|nr:AAA family ATPase [Pseudonocardiaceae bacterium]